VRQEWLWLWRGDSSGTHKGERPLLETGTRGLVGDRKTRASFESVLHTFTRGFPYQIRSSLVTSNNAYDGPPFLKLHIVIP
jgi:hypothetical protein